MPRDLREDTTLTADPERAGRFHGALPDDWKVVYIFGGVSMYAALRAMQESLGRDDLSLVTANAIFLAPVPPGPITIDVEVLRDGRKASQVAADLRVPGVASHAFTASPSEYVSATPGMANASAMSEFPLAWSLARMYPPAPPAATFFAFATRP